MANFNSVVIVGRLTRDPELRYTPKGDPVCTFGVATSKTWKGEDGEKKEETLFIDVEVWKRLAETSAEFLKKGREILVMGSLKQDRWTDNATGQKRSRILVTASVIQFLGKKPGNEGDFTQEPENA